MNNFFEKYHLLYPIERVIHVHIPKTGGMWLNKHLLQCKVRNYDHATIGVCLTQMNQKLPVWVWDLESRLQLALNHNPNMEKFERSCKISIVRNPFDWLVSYYSHVGDGAWSHHIGWDDIVRTHNITSFEHFVNHFCDPTRRWYHTWIKRNIFYQIFDEHGNVGVDIVLKNENLVNGTKSLLLDLNLINNKNQISEKRTNQNMTRKDYRSYYTPSMVDVVTKFLKQELEIFDYEFEQSNTEKDYWFAQEFKQLDWASACKRTDY